MTTADENEWVEKLRKEVSLSKMTHNFVFSRNELMTILKGWQPVCELCDGHEVTVKFVNDKLETEPCAQCNLIKRR